MNPLRVGEFSQFGCECSWVNNGIFFTKQDAVMADTHLGKDIHRLFTNRAAANDERTHMTAVEALDPG